MLENCKVCGALKILGKEDRGCITYICPKCGCCPTLILPDDKGAL